MYCLHAESGLLFIDLLLNFLSGCLFPHDRLAKIKAEAKRKREEREHDEMLRDMEAKRRQTALLTQFGEWEDSKSTQGIEKRVNLALVRRGCMYTGVFLKVWVWIMIILETEGYYCERQSTG